MPLFSKLLSKPRRPSLRSRSAQGAVRRTSQSSSLALVALLALGASLLLGGCDGLTEPAGGKSSSQTSSIHFKGARYTAERGTRVASASGNVEVQAVPDASPVSAVRIEPEERRAGGVDLLFQTGDLRSGDAFSSAALDEEGRVLGRIVHEGVGSSVNRVWADLSGFAPEAATIRFYDGEELLRKRRVDLSAGGADSLALANTSSEPDSWHEKTILNEDGEEETVIVADYENQIVLPPGNSLKTARATATTEAGPAIGRADLRPFAQAAVPGRSAAEMPAGGASLRKDGLRCTHVAIVLEDIRPGAQAASVRLARRGGGSFTITDDRFE